MHAVSVGEVLSCLEFVRRLRAEFPRSGLFVSTTTLAGHATATEKLGGVADGVFYAPVDYVFAVRRVLRSLRPSVVVVAETEIWPNLFRETKRTGAALTLVNGRVSDKAFPRYRPFRWFFRAVLPAVDSTLAQTAEIRERFVALGAAAERVHVGGNFKYDFEARQAESGSPVVELLERVRPAQVWIAASTMPPADTGDVDEDDVVIAAFQKVAASRRELMLILAPRKPERFAVTAEKLSAAGVAYVRRSQLGGGQAGDLPRVLLLDTIGELSGLFGLADVVFMGGTLARRGGHNILEPALFGKAVITGPHMENFQAIADEFRAADACAGIADGSQLADTVERLLNDAAMAGAMGQRARKCSEARRGATLRAVEEVARLHRRQVPAYRPAMPWYAVAWSLARIWEWGAGRKRERDSARRRSLPVPVISVGNLTMGGTGKTPCVLRFAELMTQERHKPGILTRGYGRSSPHQYVAVAAGADVPTEVSGDEPQIFIRSGLAPVGIGADRFESGRRLLRKFDAGMLLLDDGFQHWRLERDMDVVLIDALEPFGQGAVFPLGRLREPMAALARAHAILITRSTDSDLAGAIETLVRRWNPGAPMFRAWVEAHAWVEHGTGKSFPPGKPPFAAAGVFCGLGNPESFRRTLRRLGVAPADWIEFGDHHRYHPRELRHIAQQMAAKGATALVTTEKDMVNLCESPGELVAPLKLYWLQVKMRIEREEELLREMERRMAGKVVSGA